MREVDLLLAWYDRHARTMPWRVSPQDRADGERPNPYHVWLSEVMLQQTTVAAVTAYFLKFITLWPRIEDLARAEDADVMAAWAGLGYYARARNLLKCARVVTDDFDGAFPRTQASLLKLPGIGPYTSAAIASIAFDEPAAVLDGNVERVMARLHNDPTQLPKAKPVFLTYAETLTPDARPGDYAQAVMDLGATICTPRKPACGICPLTHICRARIAGTQAELPQKTPKPTKPTRHGFIYIARRQDGALLLETRPEKGLLGGMIGWPTSDWSQNPTPQPPIEAEWVTLNEDVRHTFTHFHLVLKVLYAEVPNACTPQHGDFVALHAFDPTALPTVMKKAYSLAKTRL